MKGWVVCGRIIFRQEKEGTLKRGREKKERKGKMLAIMD
jgi:hypothetical protein